MRKTWWLACASVALVACGAGRRTDMFGDKDSNRDPVPSDPPANDDDSPIVPLPGDAPRGDSSYSPVVPEEPFAGMRARLVAEKPAVEARQQALLAARYDLTDHPAADVTMSRGKPVQGGVRVLLPAGQTWDQLAAMKPSEIREAGLFPNGFKPLPHVNHVTGGQVLPKFHIEEIKRQEGRDLQRFDLDFDLPDLFLPEFPAPIFLTSRPDLGDTTNGKLVTIKTYFELYDGIVTPRQLDGLRLLVTPFAQQQFNLTDDRRVDEPTLGIACFDCHANGHTNAAEHLDPHTRPQESRRRLDTPSLRGVAIQQVFGSQRGLKSIEDFTEFEQLGAYFDGDQVTAAKKGFNKLDRALQVAHMAEFQNLLGFPPASKLDLDGRLVAGLATEDELKGQDLFFGKAKCSECHAPPYYTDNSSHDLKIERFFKAEMINGEFAFGDGQVKTTVLRGIRHSPPYLHDGRLLTLDDTVEFFNMVLRTGLTSDEKRQLVAFLYQL